MSQYSSPEAVLVPGPVTLVGPLEAAVDAFFVAVLFFEVSLWASTIVAARTIITSKNQILSIHRLRSLGFLRQRDHINLDQCIFRQPRHFDGRSGRRSKAEIFPIYFVHCPKIIHIL